MLEACKGENTEQLMLTKPLNSLATFQTNEMEGGLIESLF